MNLLDKKLSNVLQILLNIENLFDSETKILSFNDDLRSLNFEANDFFENLTPEFNIDNHNLIKLMKKITKIIHLIDEKGKSFFELKFNLINLQIFIPIHILFVFSSNTLSQQLKYLNSLESLVNEVIQFNEIPKFDIIETIEQKHILDNYLRIHGSSGDLYYLLCSNISLINKNKLIEWSEKCFKHFSMLDEILNKFDPLDFYIQNKLEVEDFYREIVGYYTILGNTNATNLLENLLGIDQKEILTEIDFRYYIDFLSIQSLERKLESKSQKINHLISRVHESKKNNIFFRPNDQPLDIISFKLLIALEKYFSFTRSKIRTYKKEYNQLETPASTELKNCLNLCEDWLDSTIGLTERDENILDTPFGGLFNSVFLEYLLILALDDGKSIKENIGKKIILEEKLDKYKYIFVEGNHSLEQIADFMYYKTYAQVYVYCCLNDFKTLETLIDELIEVLKYLDKRPLIKINSLLLAYYLTRITKNNSTDLISKLQSGIYEMISPSYGLQHLKDDIQIFISILGDKNNVDVSKHHSFNERIKPKILDISSWLIPEIKINKDDETKTTGFVSFNQLGDKIISNF